MSQEPVRDLFGECQADPKPCRNFAAIRDVAREAAELEKLVVAFRLCRISAKEGRQTRQARRIEHDLIEKLLDLFADNTTMGGKQIRAMLRQSLLMASGTHPALDQPIAVTLLPPATHPFLDRSIASFLAGAACREVATARLKAAGIRVVGDLVRHSEREIVALLENADHLDALKSRLIDSGLRLKSNPVRWKRRAG